MGAGTSLLWQEDLQLRSTVRALLMSLRRISRMMVTWYRLIEKRFKQRNIPITTRAWLTFGLLDAGYAEKKWDFIWHGEWAITLINVKCCPM